MKSFGTFLTKKDKDNKDHLDILKELFKKSGFQVSDFLSERKEPYIFIHKPEMFESLSFGGVRIYTRGTDIVCYRVQNKEYTEPFGTAYQLDVKGMFKDMIKEDKNKVGDKIIKHLISEMKSFFEQSYKAERDIGSEITSVGILSAPTIASGDFSNRV